ncbi:MAG: hypothetical protein ACTSV2_06585 [Candidatus Thorarchaeota archaeon]
MKRNTLIMLMIMTVIVIGTVQVQPISRDHNTNLIITEAPDRIVNISGFDSDNITVEVISPTVNSTVSGSFDITLNITSDTTPLNITLFVEGDIYSAYNHTSIPDGVQALTIDSTILSEGMLNFTCLLEDNSTGTDEKQTLELAYEVDNILVELISPAVDSTQSASFDITLNITSDTADVNITLFIDGDIYSDYNATAIADGVQPLTIDSTILGEGLLDFIFVVDVNSSGIFREQALELAYDIDNILLDVTSPVVGSKVTDTFNITIDITTDTSPLNISLYIEGDLYTDYNQKSINDGLQNITVNTVALDEGMLNFTFVLEDTISGVYRMDSFETPFYVDNQYDGITAILIAPAIESTVVGTFNITLELITDSRPVNLTLFAEDEILLPYNLTIYSEGIHNITVNTTLLPDGLLNFTFIIEDNSLGAGGYIEYVVAFNIDNHGIPNIEILTPEDANVITGVTEITTNITSDYTDVYVNITVDGELLDDYAPMYVATGLTNFTLNGSAFENGFYTIEVIVYTEEGLLDSDSVDVEFLDHIRFAVAGLTNFDIISDVVDFEIRSFTPYADFTLTLYVDDIISDQLDGEIIEAGTGIVSINTIYYGEGEHNFTFIAEDSYGHTWERTIILVVDNHGIPTIQFVTPNDDVVFGLASFSVDIESTWTNVSITVYVDDIAMAYLTNVTVSVGEYTFEIDTNNFTKAEHEVKVVVTTEEDASAEVSQIFGFVNLKAEEIGSLAFLLILAIFIPLYRKKNGYPIKGVLIMDLIFAAATVGLFVILGVSSWIFALWHLNLASIWILGSILVFANWVFPLLTPEAEE